MVYCDGNVTRTFMNVYSCINSSGSVNYRALPLSGWDVFMTTSQSVPTLARHKSWDCLRLLYGVWVMTYIQWVGVTRTNYRAPSKLWHPVPLCGRIPQQDFLSVIPESSKLKNTVVHVCKLFQSSPTNIATHYCPDFLCFTEPIL